MLIDKKCRHCGAVQHIPEWVIVWTCNECDGVTEDEPELSIDEMMTQAALNRRVEAYAASEHAKYGRKPFKRFGKRR